MSNGSKLISRDCFIKSLAKVIHTIPSVVRDEIAEEMIELNLLSRMNNQYYIMKSINKREFNRLKNYVFPIGKER